jgi:FkbM family methyltransferase
LPSNHRTLRTDWAHATDSQETDLTGLFTRGGTLFVDVGAHAGRWTLRLYPYFGHVVAFEPNTLARTQLIKNLDERKATNVLVLGLALGDTDGTTTLYTLDGTPSVSTLYPQFSKRKPTSAETVDKRRLDKVSFLAPPSLVKVDVEGAEADVLRGARGLLKTHKPKLCIETHSDALYKECSSILTDCGLRFKTLTRHYEDGGKPKQYIIRT